MERRSLLKLGLSGAALLALSGVGLGLLPTKRRAPAAPLRVLDETEYAVLAAFADRVCPARELFPSASELQVAESIDALLARCHPGVGREVKALLRLLENGLTGVLFDGRFATFTASPPEAQDAALEAWRTSSLQVRRTVFKALQGLVAGAYYGHPRAWPAIGYPGPPNFGNGTAEGAP